MNAKAVTAFLLALVFQLVQTLPAAASAPSSSCMPEATRCACCADLPSCPCANEEEAPATPLPPASGTDQKTQLPPVLPVKSTTPAPAASRPPGGNPPLRHVEPAAGYRGVSRAIAFCTFLI